MLSSGNLFFITILSCSHVGIPIPDLENVIHILTGFPSKNVKQELYSPRRPLVSSQLCAQCSILCSDSLLLVNDLSAERPLTGPVARK